MKEQPIICCDAMKDYQGWTPRAHEGLERSSADSWSLNGCCGGGCFVMTKIRFCPFCGTMLQPVYAEPREP